MHRHQGCAGKFIGGARDQEEQPDLSGAAAATDSQVPPTDSQAKLDKEYPKVDGAVCGELVSSRSDPRRMTKLSSFIEENKSSVDFALLMKKI